MINRLVFMYIFFLASNGYVLADTAKTKIEINNLGRVITPVENNNNFSTGYYASKDTYGMRANAVVAAFKANSPRPFDFPIVGFQFLKAMGSYFDRDSVSLYADNTSPVIKQWEHIQNVVYSPTSFSSNEININKIKPGMLIDTEHSPKWSTYVVSVNSGKVITAGWVNTKTHSLGTPPEGKGLIINPITKIWATNFNVYLTENAQAQKAAIQENGMVNNKIEKPEYVNGLDTVIMPYSRFGGSAAYLARSASTGNNQQWDIGFVAKGAKSSFVSSDNNNLHPDTSFLEESHAANGIVFKGANKESSILWSDGKIIFAKINPQGLISKLGYVTKKIVESEPLSEEVGRYIVLPNKDITLILPAKEKIFPGYSLKIMRIDTGTHILNFIALDGVLINGSSNFIDSRKSWNGEAVFDGQQWFIQ